MADKRQVSARIAVALVADAGGNGPDAVERIAKRDVAQVRVVVRVIRRGRVVYLVVTPRRAVSVERLRPVVACCPTDARAPVLASVFVVFFKVTLQRFSEGLINTWSHCVVKVRN